MLELDTVRAVLFAHGMMTKLLAGASLLLVACLDNTTPDSDVLLDPDLEVETVKPGTPGSSDTARTADRGASNALDIVSSADLGRSLCEQIVATDGPCAVVCDADSLLAFIPEGSCATFVCDLEDGTQYHAGACNR